MKNAFEFANLGNLEWKQFISMFDEKVFSQNGANNVRKNFGLKKMEALWLFTNLFFFWKAAETFLKKTITELWRMFEKCYNL